MNPDENDEPDKPPFWDFDQDDYDPNEDDGRWPGSSTSLKGPYERSCHDASRTPRHHPYGDDEHGNRERS